jgi:hypothetical protein
MNSYIFNVKSITMTDPVKLSSAYHRVIRIAVDNGSVIELVVYAESADRLTIVEAV